MISTREDWLDKTKRRWGFFKQSAEGRSGLLALGVYLLGIVTTAFYVYMHGGLGERLGFWIQLYVFFTSAYAAIYVIYRNGKQACIEKLLDKHNQHKANEALQESIRSVNTLIRKSSEGNGPKLKEYANKPDFKEHKIIIRVLNEHEEFASGVRLGYFSEHVYKYLRYGLVTRLWGNSREFIEEYRKFKGRPTAWYNFQWLAQRWNKYPLKSIKLIDIER